MTTRIEYRVTWFPMDAQFRQKTVPTLEAARKVAEAKVDWAPLIEKATVTEQVEIVENWVAGDPRSRPNS